jgi:hypothetical protein
MPTEHGPGQGHGDNAHRVDEGRRAADAAKPASAVSRHHPESPHPRGHLPGSHASHAHERHAGAAGDRQHAIHTTHGNHVASAGHDKHAGHSVEMFRQKFWGTLLLSIPTVIWAPMIQHWFGYQAPGGPAASRWVPAIFGTAVFGYGGWVFIRGALGEVRDRLPGMMVLISLAITVAFVFSLAVTFGFPGSDLWWELATLVTIMVLGHWIEMRSISQAQGALHELARLLPDTAVRVAGERTETVAIADLRAGDLVLVRPGAAVPADGVVREGASDLNESMIFACVHDAGRSQMAAAFLSEVADATRVQAESAGTQPGERVHPEVVNVMRLGSRTGESSRALYPRYQARAQQKLAQRGDISARSALTIHRGTPNHTSVARHTLVVGADAPDARNAERHDLQFSSSYYATLPEDLRRHLTCRVVNALEPIVQGHTVEGLVMGGTES